jgi:hypothetical protein
MNRQPMLRGNGFAVSRNLNPNLVRVESLKPLGRETRKHPLWQTRKLQASIEQFGFVLPVVIDVDGRVIAGWGLVVAAKRLGLTEVPAVTIADLDEAKLRMLRLALNRLGEDSSWNLDALTLEFSDILAINSETDLRISGFEMGEIDVALGLDRISGNMAARMSSMAHPKASCRYTRRPSPSHSLLTRFETVLNVTELSSILSGAPARPRSPPRRQGAEPA